MAIRLTAGPGLPETKHTTQITTHSKSAHGVPTCLPPPDYPHVFGDTFDMNQEQKNNGSYHGMWRDKLKQKRSDCKHKDQRQLKK